MSNLHRHLDWDFAEPARKPTVMAEIDWSNDITEGLSRYYLLNSQQGMVDLVHGEFITNAGSTVVTGDTHFDGSSDIDLGAYNDLDNTDRTIIVKAKTEIAPNAHQRILSFTTGTADTPAIVIGFDKNNGGLSAGIGGSPYNGYINSGLTALNTFFTIAFTIANNSAVELFADGVSSGTATNTGAVGTSPNGYLGRFGSSITQRLTGTIEFAMIFERVLSDMEILDISNDPYLFLIGK